MINVRDVIGRVVQQMRLSWDSEAITPEKPFYMYGSYTEMVNTLIELDKGTLSKFRKYPLIMLPLPFVCKETDSGVEAIISPIIVTLSKPNIKAKDRDNYTFDPTLYPLLDLFKQELMLSNEINETDIKIEWMDQPYWKTDGKANIASDYVDAIEITNLKLNFIKTC